MKNSINLFISISLAACSSLTASPSATPVFPTQAVLHPPQTSPASIPNQEVGVKFEFTSPMFQDGGSIPAKYSCKGSDTTPPLVWSEPPAGTKSLALIMEDPDAPVGIWVHWVIFNIPASVRGLPEGIPASQKLVDGSQQGITSARTNGYHGPCPPSGTHRYFFKLYALDAVLPLSSNADKTKLLGIMQGHILANAELMGTFTK